MVLRPERATAPQDGLCVSAWQAVERRQRQNAASYKLISQPDHAALAGALAAAFVSPEFPQLDPLMVRAIELHDAGWAIFDPEAEAALPPATNPDGKPRSFLDFAPAEFVRAWIASIDRCEEICPAGGMVVSGHFNRLARHRMATVHDSAVDAEALRKFLEHEEVRCRRLRPLATATDEQLGEWLEVLQFCDLLSLYLCCGADEEVQFPQRFSGAAVSVRRENGSYRLQPSPFQAPGDSDPANQGVSLAVPATSYAGASGRASASVLSFVLW